MNEQKEHEATKKCAVYARLDRHEAHSVEEQIATCRAEIKRQGWTLSEHHVFTDAAWYSRVAMDDRPGLKALFTYANAVPRPFDFLIVDATERFSSWVGEVLKVYSALSRSGIRIYVVPTTDEHRS